MRTQCLLHLLPSRGRKAPPGLPRDSRGAEGSSAGPTGWGRAPGLQGASSWAAAGSRRGHTAAVQSTTCRAPRVRPRRELQLDSWATPATARQEVSRTNHVPVQCSHPTRPYTGSPGSGSAPSNPGLTGYTNCSPSPTTVCPLQERTGADKTPAERKGTRTQLCTRDPQEPSCPVSKSNAVYNHGTWETAEVKMFEYQRISTTIFIHLPGGQGGRAQTALAASVCRHHAATETPRPDLTFRRPTGPGSGHHANEPPDPLGSAVQALALSLASPSFYRSRDHRLRPLLVSDSQTLEVEPSDT